MRISVTLQSVVQVELTPKGVTLWKADHKARGKGEYGPASDGFRKGTRLTIGLGELMRIFGSNLEDGPFERGQIDLVPDNLLPHELR